MQNRATITIDSNALETAIKALRDAQPEHLAIAGGYVLGLLEFAQIYGTRRPAADADRPPE